MEKLFRFINDSPTAFHAVANMRIRLHDAGAVELFENEAWDIQANQIYYVARNGSALIAFSIPEGLKGFRVFASHNDSPSYKIKENPEITVEGQYIKLNVERYGGMIAPTWFDRPLSVAGRVVVKRGNGFASRLVKVDRDLLLIPSVAIHMNREINDGYKYNPQVDLLPLYGGKDSKDTFMKIIAEAAGVAPEDILGHDLYLYTREPAAVWGGQSEFFSAPRIDDLECTCAGFEGFLSADRAEHACVFCAFDNEEVGSATRQGAASTFLKDTLQRITEALGESRTDFLRRVSESFMISADNGHSVHPNHAEKTDPTNRPVMNGGILLKYSANQRYTTDGLSAAILKDLCRTAEVPYQIFFNRSDMAGGSTLGNLSVIQVPFNTVDIGLAQLGMHSAYETAGVKDYAYMEKLAKTLFS